MDKSEKFWDKNASGYDKEEMKDRKVRIKILEKIKKYLHEEDHVLDYGCATGIIANEIAEEVQRVTGIDISLKMIRIARDKANEHHIKNVDYIRSTIFDKIYQAGTFDVVLGIYMLHLLEDMPGALKRIHELLRPGGLFISVTPCLRKKSIAGIGLLLAGKMGWLPDLNFLPVADLEEAINQADFKILETWRIQEHGQQYFVVARRN